MSDDRAPEVADLGRYGRRLVSRFVEMAREAERPRFASMLTEHLGMPADGLPIAGLDESRLDAVLDRTEGVTASFLKELLRRAAVVAADRDPGPGGSVVRVSADDLDAALADLLDTRNQMTRRALGLGGGPGEGAGRSAVGEQEAVPRGEGGADG